MIFLSILGFIAFLILPVFVFFQLFLKKKIGVKSLLLISLGVSFFVAFFFSLGMPLEKISWAFEWLSFNSLTLHWGGNLQGPTLLFMKIASWIFVFLKTLALKHSLSEDEDKWRLFIYFDLFLFSFFVAISSTYFISLLLGWEFLGVITYLLLSFSYEDALSNQASFMAFLFDKVGSVFLLLGGSFLLFSQGDQPFFAFNILVEKEKFVGIFFFIAVCCKTFQLGLNTWISRVEKIPTLPLSVVAHFFCGVPALLFLWRINLFQMDFLKSMALFLGGATFLIALGMMFIESFLKKILAYSVATHWGSTLILASAGFYNVAFTYILVLSMATTLLFGAEATLSFRQKEPFNCLGSTNPDRSFLILFLIMGGGVFMSIASLSIVAALLFSEYSGSFRFFIHASLFLFSMALCRPLFLMATSLKEKESEGEDVLLKICSFLSLGLFGVVIGGFYFWAPVTPKYTLLKTVTPFFSLGLGGLISFFIYFLFPGSQIFLSRKLEPLIQFFGKQAYLDKVLDFFVFGFKFISVFLSQRVDGFLIEKKTFAGSISFLKNISNGVDWLQGRSLSFYLLFLFSGCLFFISLVVLK